ncbi:MAG: NADH-quinone oxidoreductase subunit J [Anaerolineales bacterium]|jgi:NADH:ubiquinone oxidoreductase subunit 6 (subunit J)
MLHMLLLALVAVVFALQAIQAKRLLTSAMWLAGVSALLASLFYLMGAPFVAVIELSVGAGLVTVLFVFAISVAGEEWTDLRPTLPQALSISLALLAIAVVGAFSLPLQAGPAAGAEPPLAQVVWEQRGLDVLVQVVLIFAGVLGLLGLLAEAKAPLAYPVAEEVAARRERELEELQPEPAVDLVEEAI